SPAMRFACRGSGDHALTVRITALLAGLALIPATYLAARAPYHRRAALWAAARVTAFAPLVDFSVNGRGYALGVLLVLVSLWLGARLLDRPRRLEWAGLVVCWVLAVYTVPTMTYGVATVALWMGAVALLRGARGT